MDTILDVISPNCEIAKYVAVNAVSPQVLNAATDQQKHKFKVRLSALVRSSGSPDAEKERVFGALLIRKAVKDWSCLHSHGATWVDALLRMLNLPQRSGWTPALRTLVEIFVRVHNKPELSREIAGSKVGDLAKKLPSYIAKGMPLDAVSYTIVHLVQRYPAQFRLALDPLSNALRPHLSTHEKMVAEAYVSLIIAEKQAPQTWAANVQQICSDIKAANSDRSAEAEYETLSKYSTDYILLREYVSIAGAVGAKVPVQDVVSLIYGTFESLRATRIMCCLDFMLASRKILDAVFCQHLDSLLHSLLETTNLGHQCAIKSIAVTAKLVARIGLLPAKHQPVFNKLMKRALAIIKTNPVIGAEGLADRVKVPQSFQDAQDPDDFRHISELCQTAVLCSVKLPQSLRHEIDLFLLAHRELCREPLRIVSLYPGKYSILPMVVGKTTLEGYEALVHPRLPPLGVAPNQLGRYIDEEEEQEDSVEEELVVAAPDIETPQPEEPKIIEESETIEVEPVILPEVAPLPKIDPATSHTSDTTAIPESNAVAINDEPPAKRIRSVEYEETKFNQPDDDDNDKDNNDDDDDFVIPTLNIDSD